MKNKLERINNAVYCCEAIEYLLQLYKQKCSMLRSVGEVKCRAQAEVYYKVITDLEKILYEESTYE